MSERITVFIISTYSKDSDIWCISLPLWGLSFFHFCFYRVGQAFDTFEI